MTISEVKRTLNDLRRHCAEIREENAKIKENEETLYNLKSPIIDGMPHCTSSNGDKIGEAIAIIEERNEKSRNRIAALTCLCSLAYTLIDLCEDDEQHKLLTKRYIDGVAFKSLPFEMLMSERKMWYVHAQAIRTIAEKSHIVIEENSRQ